MPDLIVLQDFNYVVQKLTKAIYCLAIGTGSQQDRLYSAYQAFQVLDSEAFPAGDLREQWENIRRRFNLLEEPQPHQQGNVRYTLDRMLDEDAIDLAKDIVELALEVRKEKERAY